MPSVAIRSAIDAEAIEELFVELFLNAHLAPPPQITLDLDATDNPLHGRQEERFFASGSRMLPCMVLSGVRMERRLGGWMLGIRGLRAAGLPQRKRDSRSGSASLRSS